MGDTYPEWRPWLPGDGDFCRGMDAPKDADPVRVLNAFAWELDGVSVEQLTGSERVALLDCVVFMPMFSVVKSNWDDLGCDCDWHTDGHGKRTRPTWWFENRGRWLLDDVCERLNPTP